MVLKTSYDGPVKRVDLRFGEVEVALVRPAEPDRLLEDNDVLVLNRRDDYMPYWAYLWPGAFLLAEAVATRQWPGCLKALEIGCGLGLAGLVGLRMGLRVEFSDYDEAPLRFVARSAEVNGIGSDRFTTKRLDWREPPPERFPLILGADVLYERRLVPLVSDLLVQMLEPDGFALVAGPYRVATEDLQSCLDQRGLDAEARPLTARGERGEAIRGTLHTIWRSGGRITSP